MQVPRRDVPYLTDEMKQTLTNEYLPRFPRKQAATIPALHLVQDAYNCVPYQACEEIAAFLGLQASEVQDTASFYDEFCVEPRGKYLIMMCQSISCELMGQVQLLDKVAKKLGVEPGMTTGDGKFTLKPCECLGSCGSGPCALVNEDLHEDITMENFERVLDSLE
ncbi:MAG: NADH-quinone oxidoreductase subunit NuoE [Phycisphaeraceae bacterium]